MHVNTVVTDKWKTSPSLLKLLEQLKPLNRASITNWVKETSYSAVKTLSHNTAGQREHLTLIAEQMSLRSPTPYPRNPTRAARTAGLIAAERSPPSSPFPHVQHSSRPASHRNPRPAALAKARQPAAPGTSRPARHPRLPRPQPAPPEPRDPPRHTAPGSRPPLPASSHLPPRRRGSGGNPAPSPSPCRFPRPPGRLLRRRPAVPEELRTLRPGWGCPGALPRPPAPPSAPSCRPPPGPPLSGPSPRSPPPFSPLSPPPRDAAAASCLRGPAPARRTGPDRSSPLRPRLGEARKRRRGTEGSREPGGRSRPNASPRRAAGSARLERERRADEREPPRGTGGRRGEPAYGACAKGGKERGARARRAGGGRGEAAAAHGACAGGRIVLNARAREAPGKGRGGSAAARRRAATEGACAVGFV